MAGAANAPRRDRFIRLAVMTTVAIAWTACTEVSTAPDEPFSLELAPLPSPSIVSGDVLRDVDGAIAPLRGVAYNFRGDVISGAPVAFLAIDTSGALVIDPASGIISATGTNRGTARIFASIGSLQTAPRTLQIVARPTSAALSGTIDTLRYSFSNPSFNRSGPLAVIVRDAANNPVPAYPVRFRLETPGDTVVAKLVDDAGARSSLDPTGAASLDTTGSDGIAGRRIQLIPGASLDPVLDSIIVFADVRVAGAHVAGSPVRLALPVKPRAP